MVMKFENITTFFASHILSFGRHLCISPPPPRTSIMTNENQAKEEAFESYRVYLLISRMLMCCLPRFFASSFSVSWFTTSNTVSYKGKGREGNN